MLRKNKPQAPALREQKRARYYRDRYGLTLDDFEALLVEQHYRCAFEGCDVLLAEWVTKCVWIVDGEVESIVCRPCVTRHDAPHLHTRRNENHRERRVPSVRAEAPSR
jgi:hypothetical protein